MVPNLAAGAVLVPTSKLSGGGILLRPRKQCFGVIQIQEYHTEQKNPASVWGVIGMKNIH